MASSKTFVLEELGSLLKGYKESPTEHASAYTLLQHNLKNPETKAQLIVEILQELEKDITLLNNDHQSLVKSIMNLDWLTKGPELISAYQAFMLNLVSAHTFHLKDCLKMLVKKFVPDHQKFETMDELKDCQSKLNEGCAHVHFLLMNVCKIAPISLTLLGPLIENNMPYLNRGPLMLGGYTHQILLSTQYLLSLRRDILDMILKQMLKLDVRFSKQDVTTVLDAEDVDGGTTAEDSMFQMEDDTDDQKEVKTKVSAEEKLISDLPVAASLDVMMTTVFTFIRDSCHPQGELDWEATKKMYRELLSSFDTYIFTSHGINHVQFVMLYVCSFKEALADGFIDYMWKKVTNPNSQPLYRQRAACYLGSFLTRANYISTSTAKEVIDLMVRWIHGYLDQSCDMYANVIHHGPFYSVCQACFYVFCFKHNAFLQTPKGQKWAESLNFQRIITSKLNPLKICMPIIVKTFASLARTHQLAFCDTIIERNNRYSLPSSSANVTDKLGSHINLEFFPFDPYLLPRSLPFVTPLFMEFHGHLQEEVAEDSEEEDDFLPEEDETLQMTDPISMSLGKSPVDFLRYGVSPGFQNS